MAKRLNTTVHLAGQIFLPGQVVPADVEAELAWPADRVDLWEDVVEPEAAEEESSPEDADEKPKARGRK